MYEPVPRAPLKQWKRKDEKHHHSGTSFWEGNLIPLISFLPQSVSQLTSVSEEENKTKLGHHYSALLWASLPSLQMFAFSPFVLAKSNLNEALLINWAGCRQMNSKPSFPATCNGLWHFLSHNPPAPFHSLSQLWGVAREQYDSTRESAINSNWISLLFLSLCSFSVPQGTLCLYPSWGKHFLKNTYTEMKLSVQYSWTVKFHYQNDQGT